MDDLRYLGVVFLVGAILVALNTWVGAGVRTGTWRKFSIVTGWIGGSCLFIAGVVLVLGWKP